MKATYMTYIKKETTLICQDRKFNLLHTQIPECLKSGKQNVKKISYIATFNPLRNSLNLTVVSYNLEISLSSASTTIYLFV